MKAVILGLILLGILISCSPQQVVYVYPSAQQQTQPFIEQPAPVVQQDDFLDMQDPCYVDPELFMVRSVTPSITGYVVLDELEQKKKAARYFAEHVACMFERQQYRGLYLTFAPRLQKLRTMDSFVGIMQHRWRRAKAPDAVKVENIEYFEEGTIGRIFLSAENPDGDFREVSHLTITFVEGRWYVDDMHEVFLKQCFVNNDCRVPAACGQKCENIGLYAATNCDPFLSECSCYCSGDERPRQEITFYDMNKYID